MKTRLLRPLLMALVLAPAAFGQFELYSVTGNVESRFPKSWNWERVPRRGDRHAFPASQYLPHRSPLESSLRRRSGLLDFR